LRTFIGMLRLMRPANIITAIADILAGVIMAGYTIHAASPLDALQPVFLVIVATIGLYGGGVVFNDVFDEAIDRKERPERPIPSGVVSKSAATLLALGLYAIALIAAGFVHHYEFLSISFFIAAGIAVAALVYDKWGKHHKVFGPLNMGLCRGLNLLLGMSIIPASLSEYGWLTIFPVIYIAAITMISRDEVFGGKKITLYVAAFLYAVVIFAISLYAWFHDQFLYAAGFILLFVIMIGKPLLRAIQDPAAKNIRGAVKAGVLSVILMNAAWAAAFGSVGLALVICCLLPVSLLFAKIFAVT
jgi:4-hydroxybenzoate polyprenyltransferase